jgi:hypothetical protein
MEVGSVATKRAFVEVCALIRLIRSERAPANQTRAHAKSSTGIAMRMRVQSGVRHVEVLCCSADSGHPATRGNG